MSRDTHTHYFPHRHVNQVTICTVAPFVSGSPNARDLLAVGTILVLLSVQITVDLFHVGV